MLLQTLYLVYWLKARYRDAAADAIPGILVTEAPLGYI